MRESALLTQSEQDRTRVVSPNAVLALKLQHPVYKVLQNVPIDNQLIVRIPIKITLVPDVFNQHNFNAYSSIDFLLISS